MEAYRVVVVGAGRTAVWTDNQFYVYRVVRPFQSYRASRNEVIGNHRVLTIPPLRFLRR